MRRKKPERNTPEHTGGEQGAKALRLRIQRLRTNARICPVTGMLTYRHFREVFPRLQRDFAAGRVKPFGVAAFDIRDFGKYNDQYDHLRANRILRTFAKVVSTTKLRARRRRAGPVDAVYRFGGDEFIAILRKVSTRDELQAVVNRLRGPHPVDVPGLGVFALSCYAVGLVARQRGLDDLEPSIHRMLKREKRRQRAAAPRRGAR